MLPTSIVSSKLLASGMIHSNLLATCNMYFNDDLSNPFSDCPRPRALQSPGTGSLRQESSGASGSGRIGRHFGTDFAIVHISYQHVSIKFLTIMLNSRTYLRSKTGASEVEMFNIVWSLVDW